MPLIFPVHPRTRKNLIAFGLIEMLERTDRITLTEPMNYIRFMNLVFNCKFAITDSGGLQEETTYLGIPCLTMRPNTERPITVSQGTNQLVALDDLHHFIDGILKEGSTAHSVPELWDGRTAGRIVSSIKKLQ